MRNRDTAILIGAGLLLLASKKKSPSASDGSAVSRPLPANFSAAWRERCAQLNKRAKGGAAWAPRFALRLGSKEAGDAAARWVGIESGGDPRASSSLNERGLAQVSEQSLSDLGLTRADFDAMTSARTTDDQHADLAAAVIAGELVAVAATLPAPIKALAPAWGPACGPQVVLKAGRVKSIALGVTPASLGIGVAKMRHGLPLLLKELHAQGHLRSSIPLTLRSALTGAIGEGTPLPPFKPSARLAAFATGKFVVTGDPARDLLLRFLTSAAVVALGADAIPLGDAVKETANV